MPALDRSALAALIDHTLLTPDADATALDRLCREAVEHGLRSVCVQPRWVARAARQLAGASPRVCTVVGFPLGANTTSVKAAETTAAIADGAHEIDMVLCVGDLRDPDAARGDARVRADVEAVVHAARGRCVKVILETAALRDDELERACRAAVAAGAAFVKTSTGFGPGGATVGAVKRMRACVGPDVGVKASGGVRDTATALAMIEAGASRIGASASLAILASAQT